MLPSKLNTASNDSEDLDYIPQKEMQVVQRLDDHESVGRIFNVNVSHDNADDLEDYPYDLNQLTGSGSFLTEYIDQVDDRRSSDRKNVLIANS